ncbi:BrnT family toxin [Treponema socranskii]|uniref:BrnT family toxin n=1 Tax=Treponema socranskii TaxID=53419 RepID=UPI003D6EED45
MDEILFEWDPLKSDLNYTKHKVTFDEAKTVFYDENAILIADPDHSDQAEDRFIILGLSTELHMLLVCHCYKENDRIRIISARKANLKESKEYGGRI